MLFVVFLVGIAGFGVYKKTHPGDELEQAVKACNIAELDAFIGDGGKTLNMDGEGQEDTSGLPLTDQLCVLGKLQVTSAVLAHMNDTRALDGRQTDAWGDFKAAWTYHPDDGLDLTITRN